MSPDLASFVTRKAVPLSADGESERRFLVEHQRRHGYAFQGLIYEANAPYPKAWRVELVLEGARWPWCFFGPTAEAALRAARADVEGVAARA